MASTPGALALEAQRQDHPDTTNLGQMMYSWLTKPEVQNDETEQQIKAHLMQCGGEDRKFFMRLLSDYGRLKNKSAELIGYNIVRGWKFTEGPGEGRVRSTCIHPQES